MIAPVEPLSIAGSTRTPLPVDAGSGYAYSLHEWVISLPRPFDRGISC
jgi:hypothetical protein